MGRELKPTDIVHHIDGNEKNNKIENLRVFETRTEHLRAHGKNSPTTLWLDKIDLQFLDFLFQ